MKNKFNIASVSLIFIYINLGGFRLVPALVSIAFLIKILLKGTVRYSDHLPFALIITCIVMIQSAFSGSYEFLQGMMIFFIYSYWPLLLKIKAVNVDEKIFEKSLILLSLLLSLGVSLQVALFLMTGSTFGNYDIKDAQFGFAFIWYDWSYLSVAIIAPIMLVKDAYDKSFKSLIIIFILFAGSVMTSARSGFISLLIYMSLIILQKLSKLINSKGVINVKNLYNILSAIIFIPILFELWDSIQFRNLDITDDSGRFQTYIDAINFLELNFITGINFNMKDYLSFNDFAPHNIFLNLFLNGGVVFFIPFLIWFFMVLRDVAKYGGKFNSYLIITLIGLQFVPSFFAAYTLALYFSLILLIKLKNEN